MAHDPQELTLQPAQWGEAAELLLPGALAGASLANVRDQVESGRASLFHVLSADQVVAAFVLRVDQIEGRGPEGVIVAAAGGADGVDLVASCVPHIERLFRGVSRYRFHTARPGLLRKMARQGYVAREIVSYKELQ